MRSLFTLCVVTCLVICSGFQHVSHIKRGQSLSLQAAVNPDVLDDLVNKALEAQSKLVSKGAESISVGTAFEWPKLPSLPSLSSVPELDNINDKVSGFLAKIVASLTVPSTESKMDSYLVDFTAPQSLLDLFAPDSAMRAFLSTSHLQLTAPELILSLPIVAAVVLGGVLSTVDDTQKDSPYDAGSKTYSVETAAAYYESKPLFVIKRLAKLAAITGAFNLKLLFDWRFGTLEKNQKVRAKEALILSTQLGPTFIKLGQALSIRTDLIPEAYALELRQLQDAVPAFDSKIAFEIIKKEMGITDLKQKFRTISELPVASASIGQVYKATLLDGREVAIKVQRPGVLGEIALDLYLLRLITPLQVTLSNSINKRKTEQADIDVALSLVDEWGRGFVAEVDYGLEAYNTKQFSAAMVRRGLNAVTAPAVVDELSGSKVLVTEWMDGTRLDRDASPDVPRLCSTAVNAYLTMLLDTGVLHCDPHPGNLLRTKDGRLCVLDWGMTLEVPKDLQYALLEFIAHINAEDYEALPGDFVNLGFTPPNKLDQMKSSGMTEGLAFAFRQLNKGGGASKIRDRVKEELQQRYGAGLTDEEIRVKAREEMIGRMQEQLKEEGVDVNGVTNVMEEMSKRNRELFKLPPYVLYVSRAFSTLEGIGLSINEDYSILQECYPYLSKRLMSDPSPRSREALRTMLRPAVGGGSFSTDKLLEMSQQFQMSTAATADADVDGKGFQQAQNAFADLVLDTQGNYVQELLLEEAAKMTDASFRQSIQTLRKSPGGRILKAAFKAPTDLVNTLVPPPLRPLALPWTLPYAVARRIVQVTELDEEDEASLKTAESMMELARPRIRSAIEDAMGGGGQGTASGGSGGRTDPMRVLQTLTDPKGPISQLPVKGLTTLSQKFGSILLSRAAERLDNAAHKIRTDSRSRSEAMLDQVFDSSSSSNDSSSGSNGGGRGGSDRSSRGNTNGSSEGSSLALLRTVESPLSSTPRSAQLAQAQGLIDTTADFDMNNNHNNNNHNNNNHNNNHNSNDLVTDLVSERVAERTMALWALVLEAARKGIEPSTSTETPAQE